MITGIDVYHGTGNVHWARVKETGASFGICKATEGLYIIDAHLGRNLQGMQQANMVRGAYHCYKFGVDPIQQADHYVEAIRAAGYDFTDDLPLAMGLDDRKGASFQGHTIVQRDTRLFMDRLEQETHKRPILYGDREFIDRYLGSGFNSYPLWLSEYSHESAPANLPSGWTDWTIWQCSQSGTVAGVDRSLVDLDRYNGSEDELRAWAKTTISAAHARSHLS